ncbi:MAG: NAD(P)-dependent oxidoreductase [Beijerinckiaceae bacterium]|nr:NAD(P)-dependent oxidoreductase [Beijerinckiaceae bacterium]
MRVVIFGAAGFVGLNIVEALMTAGHHVAAFDLNPIPPAALALFKRLPGQLVVMEGDIRDAAIAREAIGTGTDAIILGAAVTAGPAREAAEPERIMAVNLGALIPLLERAKEIGVRRVVNLSSVAAYGQAARDKLLLEEQDAAFPVSLYAISKLASEQVLARLCALWGLSACSLRLSTVFGPWEHDTGHRDSLSPPYQIMRAALDGEPALLPRNSRRDWVYAPDVAAGVSAVLHSHEASHMVYNLTGSAVWSLLDWGCVIAQLRPGFECRLADAGETPTIDLHSAADRLPMSPARLKTATGWSAAYGLDDSARHLDRWWSDHRSFGGAAA